MTKVNDEDLVPLLVDHNKGLTDKLAEIAKITHGYAVPEVIVPNIRIRNNQVQSFQARVYLYNGGLTVDIISRSSKVPEHQSGDTVMIEPESDHVFQMNRKSEEGDGS